MRPFLNKILVAAGLGLLVLSGAVLSQTIIVPTISVLHPTDLIQVIPNGQPSAQSLYALPAQITNTIGYYKSPASQPGAGFTFSFAANVTEAAFTPTGTIASGYITLTAAPYDGSKNCVFSTAAITAIYICTASTGFGNCTQTGLNNAITTLAANARACYVYSASNQTWDRTQ